MICFRVIGFCIRISPQLLNLRCYANMRSNFPTKFSTKYTERLHKQFFKLQLQKHGVRVSSFGVDVPEEIDVVYRQKKSKDRLRKLTSFKSHVIASSLFPFVSEALQTGELSEQFNRHNLTFTKLLPTADGMYLNVYWYPNNCETSTSEIQKLLNTLAGPLRELLAETKCIAYTPIVKFVLDVAAAEEKRLYKLLAEADFGDTSANQTQTSVSEESKTEVDRKPRSKKKSVESDNDL